MSHYCPHCAVELKEGSNLCSACGKNVEQPQVTDIQSQPQQEEQPKTSVQSSTVKKSRKKLIIGISAIMIVLIIAIIAIVYLLGGTGSFSSADSRFVGEWEQNMVGEPFLWKFNNDSTLETGFSDGEMNNVGIWKVNNTQLCLYDNIVCYTYEFSNNGRILRLNISEESDSYPANIILTKKDQQGTNQTPNIECITNSTTNRIIVTMIDANVKWRDIAISTNPVAVWQVQDTNENGLAKTNTTSTITTYTTVGDSILFLVTTGEITVTMKYIPTNAVIGSWIIYV